MADEYQEVAIDQIQPGTLLRYPVLDRGSLLLVAAGTVFTDRLARLLHQRGIEKVRMHVDDITRSAEGDGDQYVKTAEPVTKYYRQLEPTPARHQQTPASLLRTAFSRRLDDIIAERGELTRTPGQRRVVLRSQPVRCLSEWRAVLVERAEYDDDQGQRVNLILRGLVRRGRLEVEEVQRLVESLFVELIQNPDLFCTIYRAPSAAPYPGLHSYLTARMSMAVAAYMDWTREEILAVGIGALCHDAGMLRLPEKVYRHRARIDSLQRFDLNKHPIYSLDLMSAFDLHEYIPFIVYQVHERANGSGYPRARSLASIHPAARLVGLVDAYVAMIAYRAHRNPLLPHHAILEIMKETQQGLWEPAVARALIRAVSLYPLGSFMELSDGRLARSVQTNESEQRSPLLEVWDDPASIAHVVGERFDLRDDPTVSILRAVPPPQIV